MAKQSNDLMTMELPGFDKPRGRPRLQAVKSGAQRTREYRDRRAKKMADLAHTMRKFSDVELARYMSDVRAFPDEVERHEFYLEFGRRNGWC